MSRSIANILRSRGSGPPIGRKTLWRAAWLLLFGMHLPATISVFGAATADGSPTAWSSLVLLAGTNLFFLLEVIFAWSLRVLSDRRCLLAFVLIVVLLHAGVIDRVMPDAVPDHGMGLWLVVIYGSVELIRSLLSTASRLRRSGTTFDWARLITACLRNHSRRAFAVVLIPRQAPYRSALQLRAPPRL